MGNHNTFPFIIFRYPDSVQFSLLKSFLIVFMHTRLWKPINCSWIILVCNSIMMMLYGYVNYVWSWMFDRLKSKIGISNLITKIWTHLSPFVVRKNDIQVGSKNDLVNVDKAFYVWCSMSVRLKPKFRCTSLIINRTTLLYEMPFELTLKWIFYLVGYYKNGRHLAVFSCVSLVKKCRTVWTH